MPCLLLSLCPSVSLQGHSWSVPSWEPRKQPAGVSSPCPLLIRTGERRRMDLGPISLGLLGSTLLLFCLHSHPYTHILKCHTFMFNTRWQLLIIGRHSPPLPNGESDFSVSLFISILDAPCPPSQVRCHSSYLVTSELNGEVNHYQFLIWNRRGNATRPSTHCSQFSSSDYNTSSWKHGGNATSQPLAWLALVLALPLLCLGHRGLTFCQCSLVSQWVQQ